MVEITYHRATGLWRSARLPLALALIAAVAFFAYWTNRAGAQVIAGLHEGSAISASGTSDTNIYIINDFGYKRWVTNPNAIFPMYGQLSLANVMSVTADVRDNFMSSGLFRDCESNAQPVYALEINGGAGLLHWVNISGDAAVAQDPGFFHKVFCINNRELAYYTMGVNYTAISQIPSYSEGVSPSPTFSPTPTLVPGNVSLSVASDNQAATTISRGGTRVPLLRFLVTNNNSASVTISDINLTRTGTAIPTDISAVYIYQNGVQVSSGMAVSGSNTVSFSGLGIAVAPNSALELTIVGDVSPSATIGSTNAFQLQSLTASGFSATGSAAGNFMTTQ